MKKVISVLITITILMSLSAFSATVNAQSASKKSMMQYKELNLTFKKAKTAVYKCKVTNNDKEYIKVDANNEGKYFWLIVRSQKPTGSKTPKITVTDEKDGSMIKRFEITVTPAKQVKMKDIKINVKTSHIITIKNPYIKDYTLKYDKNLLSITQYLYSGYTEMHTLKGLKKGTATVKAVIKGKVYGSFKVIVGDFQSSLKKKYTKRTIKYNKHIRSYYLSEGGSVDIGDAVRFFHMDAEYSVKIKDKTVAAAYKVNKDEFMPKRVLLYSLKTGKTEVAVYEKRKNAERKKLGTITLTVKKAKDREVVNANMMADNDGLFYEFFISPGDKADLRKIIVDHYINGGFTYKKFKKSEYKITYKAAPSNVLKVDKNGTITCLGLGNNKVSYTITFTDGSKISDSGSLDIVSKDFFD